MGENFTSKMEIDVDIKSSADSYFKLITSEAHSIPNASSDKVNGVDVHEGDWESHGSIKVWQYTIDGNVETIKERVEVDHENKTMTMNALEGHVLDHYKFYKLTFKPITKDDGSAVVKVTVETEKHHDEVKDPQLYIDWVVSVVKDVDAQLQKA